MSRVPVSVYLTEDEKRRIENEAEKRDMSTSELLRVVTFDHLDNLKENEISEQSNAEQRIKEVSTLAVESIEQAHNEATDELSGLAEAQLKDALYTVAILQLLSDEYSYQQVKTAITDGSQIIADNWDDVDRNLHEQALSSARDDLEEMSSSGSGKQDEERSDIGIDWEEKQ